MKFTTWRFATSFTLPGRVKPEPHPSDMFFLMSEVPLSRPHRGCITAFPRRHCFFQVPSRRRLEGVPRGQKICSKDTYPESYTTEHILI